MYKGKLIAEPGKPLQFRDAVETTRRQLRNKRVRYLSLTHSTPIVLQPVIF